MELEIFNKKITDLSKVGLLGTILFLFFIIDFLSKVGSTFDNDLSNTAIFVKTPVFIVMFYYLIKHYNKQDKNFILGPFIIVIIFFIGQFSLSIENNFANLIYNLKPLSWYLLPFPIYLFLTKFGNRARFRGLYLAFELIFYINTFFLLIGFFIDTPILKSYAHGRFGYIGLFRNISQGSYIYLIYILYFYFKNKVTPSKFNYTILIIALIASLLTGTKLLLIFVSLFIIITTNLKNILLILITIIGLTLIIIYTPLRSVIVGILQDNFSILYNLYQKEGITTMLFSLRNELFIEKFLPYMEKYWTPLNYIFGGGSFHLYRSQLEYIDLFWFFGLFGLSVFTYLWYQIIEKKVLFHPLILVLFILIGFAGNFFSSLSACISFLILLIFLKEKLNRKSTHYNRIS